MDSQRHDATALHEVFDFQSAEFAAAQPVIEEDGQNGAVLFALERGEVGGIEQLARLLIGDGRVVAFISPFSRPFDAMNGIDKDRVLFSEVIEEVGERGELPANRGRRHTIFLQRLAPGDDVGTGCVRFSDVCEPFGLGRPTAEALELRGDKMLFRGVGRGRPVVGSNSLGIQFGRGVKNLPSGLNVANTSTNFFGCRAGHL